MNHSQLTRSILSVVSLLTMLMILFKIETPVTFAQTTPTLLFADDFSGNLDKWQLLKGKATHWQVNNGRLEAIIPTGSTVTELAPKPELWNNSWDTIAISFEMTPLQGVDRNFSFWNQDAQNWSEFHFTSTFVQLFRIIAGRLDWLNDTPYVLTNNTTYQVTVKRYRDKLELWINGTKITEHAETSSVPYTGPFAMRAGTGSVYPVKVAFDNLTVTDLTPTSPVWSTFKQADPQWGQLIYDHATSFSVKPTIARWGCLLTSLVMNFHYHGLTKMPSGETITPAVLNTWLLNQSDGFMGEGLINWMAVTRLSRLIHEVYGTPKLEYQRHTTNPTTAAVQAIHNNLLPILSIPGHFLIAHGVLSNGTDFSITDPGYSYTKFSQHAAELLSTRVLVPSFTDLSYILISHDPRVDVQLVDAHTKQPLAGVSTQTEYLDADDESTEKSHPLATTQLAKPNSGNYLISMALSNHQNSDPAPLLPTTVYTYTQAADVTHWSLPAPTTTQPDLYWLRYAKETPSEIKPLLSFAKLKQTIDLAYAQKQIKSKATWQRLSTTAQSGTQANTLAQVRYIQLLQQYLVVYKTSLSPTFSAQLENDLNQLTTQLTW